MDKPKKNEIMEVYISSVTLEGMGIARLESGFVIFVWGGAPDERAEVLIMKVQKSFAYAKITRIIKPSPARVKPECPYFGLCGGCAFWHLSYEAELKIKRDAVYNNIKKLGGVDFPSLEIIGSENAQRYRNKAQFPIKRARDGRLIIGFYRRRSHDVVDLSDCLIQSPHVFAAAGAVRRYIEETGESVYDEAAHKGSIRHVFAREGRASGDVEIVVVINADKLHDEGRLVQILKERITGLSGVVININKEKTNVIMGERSRLLWGRDEIRDTIGEIEFIIPHRSFYQVNPSQTRVLYETAVNMLAPLKNETVLDLYCGAGTISAYIARRAGRVIGVEVVEDAVKVAKKNARSNGLENCEFYCGDAGETAARLIREGLKIDALCVDPPRKGLDEGALKAIAGLSPERIAYVSCDPATLGRDIKRLSDNGYVLKNAVAVDMFPKTGNIETAVLLMRDESKRQDHCR
ncbi:MAG: 23S rRNA (uracil(1939)-C(5))-methyltransferase RlmD [Clostridia bacterium]|nr:23S rRNA (uracil(1939)-C(5))-methyltransferase RlmD [Clostridia bacterium]